MPRLIEYPDDASCCLEEAVTALQEQGFEPEDEVSLAHAAGWLRRLGNNRSFIGDILVGELAGRHHKENELSSYGPQVIMLSRPSDEFFLRANIWPSADEHMFRASGGSSFVYGLPHDHNFDFLTHGYFGPGYWSDYYEFDYQAVDGWAGEKANLRFIERSRLERDKLMLYRAHRDVHAQIPPDSLSVSLNIMHMRPSQGWYDQYRFDLDRDEVTCVLNHGPSEVFLRVAVGLGGDEAQDLAEIFGQTHPSDWMRMVAWEAARGPRPGRRSPRRAVARGGVLRQPDGGNGSRGEAGSAGIGRPDRQPPGSPIAPPPIFRLTNPHRRWQARNRASGYSLVVKHQPSKLAMRVRFPLPAPALHP